MIKERYNVSDQYDNYIYYTIYNNFIMDFQGRRILTSRRYGECLNCTKTSCVTCTILDHLEPDNIFSDDVTEARGSRISFGNEEWLEEVIKDGGDNTDIEGQLDALYEELEDIEYKIVLLCNEQEKLRRESE